MRSHNSWMHNAPLLMRGGRTQALRTRLTDAEAAGLADGAMARLSSESGSVEVPVIVTDEMTPGTARRRTAGVIGAAGAWRTRRAA